MKVDGRACRTIWREPGAPAVQVIDQRDLPHRWRVQVLRSHEQACVAIAQMWVRGAPLIGVTAAYNMVSRFLEALQLPPASVVIELTEDFPAITMRHLRESLLLYRSMGFRVALDDLGEGFSTLRLWSELRPEFVKADKHFVRGIARDAVKRQFLRSIHHIARRCGSQVIAEGIEGAEDLRAVRRIGVAMAQGWYIGRPGATLA